MDFFEFLLENIDEDYLLKMAMVEDILDMIENCRTEDTLRQELLEYFDGIEFDVIE